MSTTAVLSATESRPDLPTFERPGELQANSPPEWRGVERDAVRLLVSDDSGHHHSRFHDIADHFEPGDLLVVNESATLPASLPAQGRLGEFRLNLSTRFDDRLWLAEPRWSVRRPGPMPWRVGDAIIAGDVAGRLVAPFAGTPRLWFVAFDRDVSQTMARHGQPIRYQYLQPTAPPLAMYQTIFARIPGSAEMPSAARPFTVRVLDALARRGVRIATVVLHTGVSSLEVQPGANPATLIYPEPFCVPADTARLVNDTRSSGGRVVAVGTTVARALESAQRNGEVRAASGFARLFIEPQRGVRTIDGLITGLHDPRTTHLALLTAIAGEDRVRSAYAQAIRESYLWHEFGDSHLLWKPGTRGR